jgi:phosphoglycolate phosphatase-like HAD superfamily hydrolase
MVDKVIELTGCNKEDLLDDFKKVHQKYQNTEHPYSLLETKIVLNLYPNKTKAELKKIFAPAFQVFEESKNKNLKKYPYVNETFEILIQNNIKLAAHTESGLYAVSDRLQRLDLTKYFSIIYCRERPAPQSLVTSYGEKIISEFPMHKIIELSHHQRKPDPTVLLEICDNLNTDSNHAVYIGDSMARDVLMAKDAGIFSIWAAYGTNHPKNHFKDLVRVTHWREEDVEREEKLYEASKNLKPDYIAKNNFNEILMSFDIGVNQNSINS